MRQWAGTGLIAVAASLGLVTSAAAQNRPAPGNTAAEQETPSEEKRLKPRRPHLTPLMLPGRDLSLEVELSGSALVSMGGDAHAGTNRDYEDIFSGGTGFGLRVGLGMRFGSRGNKSFWAGPVVFVGTTRISGKNDREPSGDVLVVDDMRLTRLLFGGLFRMEIGRGFFEGWSAIGVAHTTRLEAVYDQSVTSGLLTPLTLFRNSTMFSAMAALRGGWVFRPSPHLTISLWGTLGVWYSGAPDDASGAPLTGPVDPDPMSGVFVGAGITFGFGLGDWPRRRRAPVEEAPPRRIGFGR